MSKRYYMIVDLADGLNGRIVSSRESDAHSLVYIDEILLGGNLGDSECKVPVADGGLIISRQYLKEVPDFEEREYASDNPYGKIIQQEIWMKEGMSLFLIKYENMVTVTMVDDATNRTLYSQNFSKDLDIIYNHISDAAPYEDFITMPFFLKELKETQLGQA